MAQVEFLYKGTTTTIECQVDQKIADIFNTFISKANINENEINYYYNDKIVSQNDKNRTFNEFANSLDKSNKKMKIIVKNDVIYDYNTNKDKNIIFPGGEIKMKIKIKEDEKNKEEQTIKIKKKSMVSNCNDLLKHLIDVKHSLNYLYRCAPKSRFNFANGNNNLTGKEICQIIPSKINDFITQQFVRHSFFYQDKQNNINDIYFSLNSHSLDSDDSWSSLISIINKYNNKEECLTNC